MVKQILEVDKQRIFMGLAEYSDPRYHYTTPVFILAHNRGEALRKLKEWFKGEFPDVVEDYAGFTIREFPVFK